MNRNGNNRGNGNGRRPFDFDNAPPPPATDGKSGSGMKMFSFPVGSVSTLKTGTAQPQQPRQPRNSVSGTGGQSGQPRKNASAGQRRAPLFGRRKPPKSSSRQPSTVGAGQRGGAAGRAAGQDGRQPRPAQQNPQSPGYRQGAPHPRRRLTQNEKNRIKRNRFIAGLLLIGGVVVLGIVLSVNLLFKVTEIRIENMDKTTPANTGIYSEQQIIDLLGVQTGDNLFGFSTTRRAKALAKALPYLDTVQIYVRLPGTVIVRIQSATERYAIPWNGQWLTLSDNLKVLSIVPDRRDGLIWLDAVAGADTEPTVGRYLTIEAPNTATEETLGISTAEEGALDATETLKQLLAGLEQFGFLDGTTLISVQDLSQISFLYEGRISVQFGTINNLDYKLRLAANAIFDTEGKGLSASDRGTLDVSYQREDGEIYGYFNPAEPIPAQEEPPAEGQPEEDGEQPQEGDAAADEQAATE